MKTSPLRHHDITMESISIEDCRGGGGAGGGVDSV